MWTDGSRLQNGRVGAAVVWWGKDTWTGRGSYLGSNKEVFDSEVFAILRAVRFLQERKESGKTYTVFSDSQAPLARIQHSECGPVQTLASRIISFVDEITSRGNSITFQWAPAHMSIEGNEKDDELAKRAAEGSEERADPEYLGEANFSHLTRKAQRHAPRLPATGSVVT